MYDSHFVSYLKASVVFGWIMSVQIPKTGSIKIILSQAGSSFLIICQMNDILPHLQGMLDLDARVVN